MATTEVGREYHDVVVVGAGLAGLNAARTLLEAWSAADAGAVSPSSRSRVLVLEARDRIGGRVLTADIGGGHIDLGAAWMRAFAVLTL